MNTRKTSTQLKKSVAPVARTQTGKLCCNEDGTSIDFNRKGRRNSAICTRCNPLQQSAVCHNYLCPHPWIRLHRPPPQQPGTTTLLNCVNPNPLQSDIALNVRAYTSPSQLGGCCVSNVACVQYYLWCVPATGTRTPKVFRPSGLKIDRVSTPTTLPGPVRKHATSERKAAPSIL